VKKFGVAFAVATAVISNLGAYGTEWQALGDHHELSITLGAPVSAIVQVIDRSESPQASLKRREDLCSDDGTSADHQQNAATAIMVALAAVGTDYTYCANQLQADDFMADVDNTMNAIHQLTAEATDYTRILERETITIMNGGAGGGRSVWESIEHHNTYGWGQSMWSAILRYICCCNRLD
jgi:hypothetical protein